MILLYDAAEKLRPDWIISLFCYGILGEELW